MRRGVYLLLLLSLVISGQGLLAQVTTAAISGVIRDETGAVLPGVSVTIKNLDTGISRTAVTDEEGRYHAPNLSLGNYEVRAELAGFQTGVRSGIKLTLGREAVLDFTLKVGEITERVVVTGEAPLINTTNAVIAGLVDERKVRDLPLNARNLISLAPLYAGVSFNDTGEQSVSKGFATKLTISGTRYTANRWQLDGSNIADMTGSAGSAAGLLMGVETIREFNVVTDAYSAEYGEHTGGVFNAVTKSGTNRVDGSVFLFHRNDNLDARNFFDPEEPPEFKRNQFGFALGGPVIKDRTFAFGSYEALRERLGVTRIFTVPNAQARRGILPGQSPIPVNPNVKPFLESYPLPNGRDFGDGRGEFIQEVSDSTDEDFFTIRIDHKLSDRDSFFGRYTFDDAIRSLPGDRTGFNTALNFATRSQYITLDETHIFSANVINKFLFTYNRSSTEEFNTKLAGFVFPSTTFTNRTDGIGVISVTGLSDWGGRTIAPRFGLLNLFQWKDDLAYTRGSHSVKAGLNIERYRITHANPFNSPGQFSFLSLADFLRGRVDRFQALLPETEIPHQIRQTLFGFYLQDDIRLRSNFTLNLGLRYEFVTTPTAPGGRVANARDYKTPGLTLDKVVVGDPYYLNPSLTNFAPRIGFAWDPFGSGKTSIRAGFGIFYDQIRPGSWAFGFSAQPPLFVRGDMRRVRVPEPIDFPNAFFKQIRFLRGTISLEGFQFDANQPAVYKWSLGIQREIVSDLTVEAGYSATRGVHLIRMLLMNAPVARVRDGRLFIAEDAPLLHPGLGRVRPRFTDTESSYHSFRLSLNRRFDRGLQFQGSYTVSKVLDDASTFTGSSDFPKDVIGQGSRYLDFKLDYGPSEFDVRHSFLFNFTYDLPVGSGRHIPLSGATDKILGRWGVSGILRLNSGNPFSVATGALPRFMDFIGDFPDLKPNANPNPIDPRNPDRYFDPSSFAPPPGFLSPADLGGAFIGNLGRNTLVGPGVANFDLVLTKDFNIRSISEDFSVQFRAELFNLFNRANFDLPEAELFDSRTGAIRRDAGRITSTVTSSRQIQFGLKILF